MSTQVATSHAVHTRAQLRVPKRPPRNYVSLAIQRSLPYAVVFLLSLIIYTSFRQTNNINYPPYSPPGMSERAYSEDTLGYMRDTINKRTQRLEELKRKSAEQGNADPARWKQFKEEKAEELKTKLAAANVQSEQGLKKGMPFGTTNIKDDIQDTAGKMKVRGEEFAQQAADKTRAYGEKLADTKDFAYDAMYAWKQKANTLKETGKETLIDAQEKLAETGKETFQAAQEKLGEVKDKAADVAETAQNKVSDVFESVQYTLEVGKETLQDAQENLATVGKETIKVAKEKFGEAKERAADMAESMQSKVEDVVEGAKETIQDLNTNALKEKGVEAWETIQQTAEQTRETVKNVVGEDNIEAVKEKLSEVSEKAKEAIESAKGTVQNAFGNVVGTAEGIVGGKVEKRISQAEYDFVRRHKAYPLSSKYAVKSEGKFSGLLERVKAGLVEDEQVRQVLSMQEEWSQIELKERADMIVQQLQLLGDDVVQEVASRLGENKECSERLQLCENKRRS